MSRSNLKIIREINYSSSDEDELLIMRKSQETFVKEVKTNNYLLTCEDDIIFCSTEEDEDNNYDELNKAVIYSSQDKLMNDIKKWNCLRKLNNREPVYYCITQLEHILNNVSNLLERINN